MTEPRKPRTRRKPAAGDDAALKAAVLEAALPHVPPDGFTDKVLADAAAEAGLDKILLARLFPDGPLSLVEAFSENIDAEMEKRLAKQKLAQMKIRDRIRTAVTTRLELLKPHKEATRRAAAFLTLPPHAAMGAKLLYRTVDAIWRAIGDTSTDFNFYTKRAILAAVYSSTLMRWFTDDSEGETAAQEFLDHRIENVMQFEKLKADFRERAKGWPSFADILRGGKKA
ncbi:MAG: COQ9 family protein [Rhizomicrobium sp.]